MSALRPNPIDRLLLGGRDPYRPAKLLRVVRLQAAFATSLLVMLAFTGWLWWAAQQSHHRDCLERNARTAVSVRILGQLAAAADADGDANQAAVWRQWVQVSRGAPVPRC